MKLLVLSLLVTAVLCDIHPGCSTQYNDADVIHIPHEIDCTKFYKCTSSGEAFLMECGENLSYNEELQVCDHMSDSCYTALHLSEPQVPQEKPGQPMNPSWPQQSLPQQDYRCASTNSGNPIFLPHPFDCNLYYMCDHGMAYPKNCPHGQHFNERGNYCDNPETANCKGQWGQQQPQWPNTPQLPVWPQNPQPQWPQGPQYPHIPQPLPQPEPQPQLPQPMLPSSGCPAIDMPGKPSFLPHENDCTKFYACGNGIPVLKSCPSGQHWSIRHNWCDWPSIAMCQR